MKTHLIRVALDIESTGFDTSLDQVIEIAAVKFEGDKIIDTFETFINPGIKIPPIITHITGIKDADVEGAPTLESVKEKLENFMGDAPIVGHNIDFDVNFLRAKGVSLLGPLYDTLQLSMILLPGLASYSMDTLGRALKLDHKNKHRAMTDTIACMKLYRILEEKIAEIDAGTLEKIGVILGRSSWSLAEIFSSQSLTKAKHTRSKAKGALQTKSFAQKNTNLPEGSSKTPPYQQSGNELLEAFAPSGKLSTILKNYESRPSQQHMAELILDALTNKQKKLIEAGTGVGKTLAYLMAAAHHSLTTGKKIVVSTYTHTLQGQLLNKDVPLLKQLFEPAQIEVAVLKGRRNYLSHRRFELLLQKDFFPDHEITFILKIFLWLNRSQSGDLDELTFVGKEFGLLDEVCCAEYACSHDDAEFKNGCYLIKARQKAMNADIIIINHALLLQDSNASENPILPQYDDLIIDEAHHLENVATDAFTISLSFHSFQRPFEKLKRNLDALARQLQEANLMNELQTLKQNADQIMSRIEIFFGLAGIFMEKNLPYGQSFPQIHLSERDLASKEWQQAVDAGKNITESVKNLLENIKKLSAHFEEKTTLAWKEVKGAMHQCENKIADLRAVLENAPNAEIKSQMTWISKTYDENITVRRSPIDVGPMLNSVLWNTKESIVLTSATLRTDHTFNFIKDQLGLDQSFQEAALPSHFSYPDQVKILIPEDLPEPASEGYFNACAEIIANVIRANGGRTLVLFTAKKALAATYHKIAPTLKTEGFTVLGQQITGGRGKILEHFKDEPGTSAIFGTQSFWEGVDLPGKDLNCVIIQKLPFDPPDDPMIVARCKKYRDPWNEYRIPRAILKFKQGFGRLIRSATDTGTIIVLDTRLITSNYGPQFLESLPEGIQIKYGSQNKIHELL